MFTLMSPFHEGWNVDCMSKEDQVFDGICVLDSICMSASSVQLVRLWSIVSTEAVKCVVWVKEREVEERRLRFFASNVCLQRIPVLSGASIY